MSRYLRSEKKSLILIKSLMELPLKSSFIMGFKCPPLSRKYLMDIILLFLLMVKQGQAKHLLYKDNKITLVSSPGPWIKCSINYNKEIIMREYLRSCYLLCKFITKEFTIWSMLLGNHWKWDGINTNNLLYKIYFKFNAEIEMML